MWFKFGTSVHSCNKIVKRGNVRNKEQIKKKEQKINELGIFNKIALSLLFVVLFTNYLHNVIFSSVCFLNYLFFFSCAYIKKRTQRKKRGQFFNLIKKFNFENNISKSLKVKIPSGILSSGSGVQELNLHFYLLYRVICFLDSHFRN